MVTYVELDWGFMTVLSILAGLFNNIVVLLVTAMVYHHYPNRGMKAFYFLVYFVTAFIYVGGCSLLLEYEHACRECSF